MPDLAADLERIARIRNHIPCLERAAADESAPAEVRERAAEVARLLAASLPGLSGHSRTVPNDTPTPRTEATP